MNKFVKAIALIAVVAFVLAGFVGCGGKQTWSDENVVFSYDENGDPVITFPDNFEYPESSYEEFGLDPNAMGIPVPYDFYNELNLAIQYKRISSLYLVKIIKKLSIAEAEKLENYKNSAPYNYSTFYEAVLIYDYLRDKELNESIIYRMGFRDNKQIEGYPPYQSGDCFVALLTGHSGIVNAVAAPPLFVLDTGKIAIDTCAYTQGRYEDILKDISVDLATTGNSVKSAFEENPRKLYQKLIIRDYVEFIKEKFAEVGYEVK